MKYFSPSLLDGSVTTAKLADNAVTELKLADNAVATAKVQDNSLTKGKILDDAIVQSKMRTAVVSTSGNITTGTAANLVLTAYCFWPMIHVQAPTDVSVSGHLTDAPGADNPRLALFNSGVADRTYDVDYRYLVV